MKNKMLNFVNQAFLRTVGGFWLGYYGMLVYWYAGILVIWYAGMLVCWYIGTSVH